MPALAPGQTRLLEDAEGRISGEVMDARTGEPAAGVPVALYRPRTTTDREWPEPWVPDVPDLDSTPIATVRAASEGQFLFEGLEPGHYRVVVLLATRTQRADVVLTAENPSGYARLSVHAGATLRGTVRTESGTTLGGVFVYIAGEDDGTGRNVRAETLPEERTVSKPDGTFVLSSLPTGVFWFQAGRRDYGFSEPVLIETWEKLVVDGVDLVVRDERERIAAGQAERGGIGVVVAFDGRGVRVRRTLPDMPAAAAGLEAEDRILAIDGRSTAWMTRLEFLSIARGGVGDPVTVTWSRADGPPVDTTLSRARMPD